MRATLLWRHCEKPFPERKTQNPKERVIEHHWRYSVRVSRSLLHLKTMIFQSVRRHVLSIQESLWIAGERSLWRSWESTLKTYRSDWAWLAGLGSRGIRWRHGDLRVCGLLGWISSLPNQMYNCHSSCNWSTKSLSSPSLLVLSLYSLTLLCSYCLLCEDFACSWSSHSLHYSFDPVFSGCCLSYHFIYLYRSDRMPRVTYIPLCFW
jgi:hypothetical protein